MMKRILLLIIAILFTGFLMSCSSASKEDSEGAETTEKSLADEDASSDDEDAGDEDFASDEEESDDEDFAEEDAAEESDDGGASDEEAIAEEDKEESLDDDLVASDDSGQEQAEEEVLEDEGEIEPLETAGGESAESVSIQNISFQQNETGGAVVVQTSGTPTYQTRMNAQTNQFILEIANADLPNRLKQPMITKDFPGTAFNGVNAYQNPGGNTARIVMQLRSNEEPTVQQEGGKLVIVPSGQGPVAQSEIPSDVGGGETIEMQESSSGEMMQDEADTENDGGGQGGSQWTAQSSGSGNGKILQATTLEEYLLGTGRFYGERISIETAKGADIRDVLNFISEESGVNMVLSGGVQGEIQLKLREVPWDQAFTIALRTKGLGYVRQGNVLRVATLSELEAEATAAKNAIENAKVLQPLRVRVIPISYAKGSELVAQIKPFLSKDRSAIGVDNRTNSLIIKDIDDVLEKVSRLIKELDVPPPQVMIEGKIVEATESFTESFGVNWGLSGGSIDLGSVGGSSSAKLTHRVGINPLSSTAGGTGTLSFSMGRFDGIGNLNMSLALAESKDEVKIISSPRVLAINKESATISQKGQVFSPVQTTTDGGSTTTYQPRDYILDLNVTPQVTSNGSVIMDIDIKREFPGAATPDGNTPVNSRNAKTKILIDNGQTAVIGGVFQSDSTKNQGGVPVLKDLPLLGWLFKAENKENVKTELLIFLTPRIVNQPKMLK